MSIGYVYVLFNPAFRRNRYKVGRTARTPEERARELSADTGVPEPYEVHYKERVRDCVLAERLIHERLRTLRRDTRREFFEAPLSEIIAVLRTVAEEVGIVGEDTAEDVESTADAPMVSELQEASPDYWEVEVQGSSRMDKRPPKSSGRRPTVEGHLRKVEPEVRTAFVRLREQLMGLADVREKSLTYGIAYETAGRNFLELFVKRRELELLLRPVDYPDPDHIIERVPDSHAWTLNRRVRLHGPDDVERAWTLIVQSHQDVAQT